MKVCEKTRIEVKTLYPLVECSGGRLLRNGAKVPVVLGRLQDGRDERDPAVPRWLFAGLHEQHALASLGDPGRQDATGRSGTHLTIIFMCYQSFLKGN